MTNKQKKLQSLAQKKRYAANKLAYKLRAAKYYQDHKEEIKKKTNNYRKSHLREYTLYYASYGKKG
jgi:hypothetical protein